MAGKSVDKRPRAPIPFGELPKKDQEQIDTLVLAKLEAPILDMMACLDDRIAENFRMAYVGGLFKNRDQLAATVNQLRIRAISESTYKNVEIDDRVKDDGIDIKDFDMVHLLPKKKACTMPGR